MSIRAIPAAYEYKCDNCGKVHLQENASGHYSNSCPPTWMAIKISQYNKAPADILLCENCETIITSALDSRLLAGVRVTP